jgi:thioredoxin reductase/SAM-dependent methyltransferase
MENSYDVVVVGGGAAGLSGALTLARAGRSVLVVDAGEPRNAPAGHVHNYLGREGMPPAELYAMGRAEVAGYGGELVAGRVSALRRTDDCFAARLDDGRTVHARRLLVTTGLVDELPAIPGVVERWGRDVLHCPYCHGHEVRDRPIGVLATGAAAVQQALLWRQWSADVVLFRHTGPDLSDVDAEALAARGIEVVDGEVAALEVAEDRLTGVRLADGRIVPREAVVVAARFEARAEVLTSLGLTAVEQEMNGTVIGSAVPADAMGATAVPGVWVAGNVTDLRAQVITAAAQGVNAAAALNADLVAEDTRRAVAARRLSAHGGVFDRAWWDERYRSAPELWSGRPNAVLVAEAADLPPGRALDAGSGEGGDALWLADRGWQVTAVDLSAVAVDRGARAAEERGLTARTVWRQADLTEWAPPAATFDLVCSSFLHLPAGTREPVLVGLAAAVVPGGTLLVVGHDHSDVHATVGRPDLPEFFASPEQLAALLDPAEWQVEVAEARPRRAVDPEGREVDIADAVLRARRRSTRA